MSFKTDFSLLEERKNIILIMFPTLSELNPELLGTLKIVSRSSEDFIKLCHKLNKSSHTLSFSDDFQLCIEDDERLINFENQNEIFALTVLEFRSENQFQLDVETFIFRHQCDSQIPGVSTIELWDDVDVDYQFDCPGAKVIHHYFPSRETDITTGKITVIQKSKKYSQMLQSLLLSESPLRNLNNVVSPYDIISVSELLHLMRITCLGLVTDGILNYWLTRELYDPRLLYLIARFGDNYSIVEELK